MVWSICMKMSDIQTGMRKYRDGLKKCLRIPTVCTAKEALGQRWVPFTVFALLNLHFEPSSPKLRIVRSRSFSEFCLAILQLRPVSPICLRPVLPSFSARFCRVCLLNFLGLFSRLRPISPSCPVIVPRISEQLV